MQSMNNDTVTLTPITEINDNLLRFDFPGLEIGVAEYREGPTGCTVFHFPQGAQVACDVRGGIPGTIMVSDGYVDAICLAGGSLLGLEAATGVSAELFARRNYSSEIFKLPVVRGAIIFDFGVRQNSIYPDNALGRAALRSVRPGVFPQGGHGAGCSASVGNGLRWDGAEASGQGGAFRQIGETKVAVFSVVNAIGAIVDRQGNVVRGHRDPQTGQRTHFIDQIDHVASQSTSRPTRSTTLTVVVTNQKVPANELTQMGRQVHSSMARAIQPFHTGYDGDTLFAVSTNEIENDKLLTPALGAVASELAWDAILCAVPSPDK